MKNITIAMPVKQTHINTTKKIMQGDRYAASRYEQAVDGVAFTVAALNKKEKKKKLTAEELDLREKIKQILPVFFQLDDDCMEWDDKHRYVTAIRRCILTKQKKAAKGNKEAKKEYNRLVRIWGKHEPGRFSLI